MISSKLKDEYLATIGIECHVQLKTATKLFAAVGNDAREASPNTLVSHICFGLPGALPVLNREAVHLAVRAAFALGVSPQKFSTFDRKNYFYPDLPLGYQITQYEHPIVIGGNVEVLVDGESKSIGITRAHLEADAGKSTHPNGKDYSLVDLNRVGTPLLEIVSEPDMHSAVEAKAYAKELYLRMKYADISYADLYYGNMRFDVNVSVSKEPQKLGTRSETKNLNSFRSVEKTVDYEINRQIELLEKGGKIMQETRGWDDAKQKTFSQRSKEEAHDYRYFPEPDIPPIELSDNYIEQVRSEMPIMPSELNAKLQDLQLDHSVIETLIEEMPAGQLMLKIISSDHVPKSSIRRIANWLAVDVQSLVAEGKAEWENLRLEAGVLVSLTHMMERNQVSSTAAKKIIEELIINGGDPLKIAEHDNLLQVSDEAEIIKIVNQVLADNPKAAEDVKNGEAKAIGFLVGQVMKASKGKANPSLAQVLIKKQLGLGSIGLL